LGAERSSRSIPVRALERSLVSLLLGRLRAFLCVCPIGLLLSVPSLASDWPRFRGPNGTGVSQDAGLPEAIGPDRNVAWTTRTPQGNSSPIVVAGRLILTGHDGDERIVLCLGAANGEQIWRRSLVRERAETFNPRNGPTTPTPTTDGQNVFVLFPEIGLLAYDREGTELWRTPLGPFRSVQGLAASPILVDGKVVLQVDTPEEAYVAAFDASSGKPVWRAERPTGVLGSYATPTVYSPPAGPTQVVVAGAVELTGYDVASGGRLWWARGVTVFPTGPPFVDGDSVYTVEPVERGWPPFGEVLSLFDKDGDGIVALADAQADLIWQRSLIGIDRNSGNGDGVVTRSEYDGVSSGVVGGGLCRLRIDGRGEVGDRQIVFRHEKGMPGMAGALLYQGVLYVVRNAVVTTFDPETGRQLRQERIKDALGEYYASPVAGDGKLYLASLDGKVTVLKAGADWQVLSTADLGEPVIATPAIADGHVFIRTEKTLYAFGARQP
jgi:outer membrane protein assembly factor BamB